MLVENLRILRHWRRLVEELLWLVAHQHWVLGYKLLVHALPVEPLSVMGPLLGEGLWDLAGLSLIYVGVSAHDFEDLF